MPVVVKQLHPTACLVSYHGQITIAQLETAYRKVLALDDIAYILADGLGMIYSDEVLFNESIRKLVIQKISQKTTKYLIVVASEDHPIREPITQFHERIASLHKIKFVDSYDKGIELINAFLK